MAEHTPGPWEALSVNSAHFEAWDIETVDETRTDYLVAEMISDEANARLIAAAPDLLDACEIAITFLVGGHVEDALDVLRKAGAKARGDEGA